MSDWKFIDTCFLYDGSFDGLLCLVFDCFISKEVPIRISTYDKYETNLLENPIYFQTDLEKSKRIYDGIVENISFDTLYNAYHAFLADTIQKRELVILQYLLLGFKLGPRVNTMLGVDYVMDVILLRKKVLMEAQKLKGLIKLRFLSNNLYYAPVHPTHNLIENIGHHFMKRFPTQDFILHDKNRESAFLYHEEDYKIVKMPSNITMPEYSKEEKLYQSLWRTFYDSISIKERINPRLQMQYMPKKYWQDLIEKT